MVVNGNRDPCLSGDGRQMYMWQNSTHQEKRGWIPMMEFEESMGARKNKEGERHQFIHPPPFIMNLDRKRSRQISAMVVEKKSVA